VHAGDICAHINFLFFKFYLFIHQRERKHMHKQGGGAEGEGKTGSPLSKEPNAGLNPWALGS